MDTQKVSTIKIIDLLNNASSRGFCSEPIQHRFIRELKEQRCFFTEEEKREVHLFMAQNQSVLRKIDYPLMGGSLFDDREKDARTISLLGMISYMLDSGDSPEYVANICQKIEDILDQLESPLE